MHSQGSWCYCPKACGTIHYYKAWPSYLTVPREGALARFFVRMRTPMLSHMYPSSHPFLSYLSSSLPKALRHWSGSQRLGAEEAAMLFDEDNLAFNMSEQHRARAAPAQRPRRHAPAAAAFLLRGALLVDHTPLHRVRPGTFGRVWPS